MSRLRTRKRDYVYFKKSNRLKCKFYYQELNCYAASSPLRFAVVLLYFRFELHVYLPWYIQQYTRTCQQHQSKIESKKETTCEGAKKGGSKSALIRLAISTCVYSQYYTYVYSCSVWEAVEDLRVLEIYLSFTSQVSLLFVYRLEISPCALFHPPVNGILADWWVRRKI